ncbi:MAG TPA: sulfatase, partial [Leptospiraceae bacterium]|nr:sulfatase [Leptospiraceae bacterium]
LIYHWKKNAGRYSGLKFKDRWQNAQMGFQLDKEIFLNRSLDSIQFSPNSSLKIPLDKGDYEIRFSAGILEPPSAGSALSFSDGSASRFLLTPGNETQKWTDYVKEIRIESGFLNISWSSSSTHIYLGRPYIRKKTVSEQPSVYLFIVDSLRPDGIKALGGKLETSPNIDQLASESLIFEKHFANANWTKPSMISMFRGQYSSNLGIVNPGFPVYSEEKQIFYNAKEQSITEILRKNNYYTATIMNNVFFQDYTGVGVDLGFHEAVQIGKDIQDTEHITKHSLKIIEENSDRPQFLHINYNTPHGSYSPPSAVLREMISKSDSKAVQSTHPILLRYYGEVRYTDLEIGKIIDYLKKINKYDSSMIIITSDHGDLFNENHTFKKNEVNGTRFGHGETHYDEEIQIPLIIKLPKKMQQTAVTKTLKSMSSSISLLPTIAGFLNIPIDNTAYPGLNYADYFSGKNPLLKESFVLTEGRMSDSVRTEKYKYVYRPDGYTNYHLEGKIPPKSRREEFYDLNADPAELKNLTGQSKEEEDLKKIRNDNRLKRNSLKIRFPKGYSYQADLFLSGEFYEASLKGDLNLSVSNRRQIRISGTGKEDSLAEIGTFLPKTEFSLNLSRNGAKSRFRTGQYGILGKTDSYSAPEITVSLNEPFGFAKSEDVWIYNDGVLLSNASSQERPILGSEVRTILKSWGYIQE